jgi:hypothetical protein
MAATTASAQTVFTVDSTLDQVDDDTVDIACHTAAGTCTLRAAVMQANEMLGDSTILLPPGVYTLTRLPSGGNGSDSGDLNLANVHGRVITLVGTAPSTTIIDANGLDRALRVAADSQAVVRGITIRNGRVAPLGDGGAIYNGGGLTLAFCVLESNSATRWGGAIFNGPAAFLELDHSTVIANQAPYGGGIYNANYLELTASTLADNQANLSANFFDLAGFGGGLYNAGVAHLINSTISGNRTEGNHGGGVYNAGELRPGNTTITGNRAKASATNNATGQGGGVYQASGPGVFFGDSILAGNTRGTTFIPDDCKGAVASLGRNRFSTYDGCTVIVVGADGFHKLIDSLAELGPLQANGGPTATHALVPPSDMIDGTSPFSASCQPPSGKLLVDQRDGPRTVGGQCDLGSVEHGALPFGLIFADGMEAGNLWLW